MSSQDKRKRQLKTPAQRAQEALLAARRRVERLQGVVDALRKELAVAETDLERAVARRDHAAGDPDLPPAEPAQEQP